MATCVCGREITQQPHCPNCGSTNTYGKSSLTRLVRVDGKEYRDRGFRCRKCETDFNESQPCKATKIGEAARAEEYSSIQSLNAQRAGVESTRLMIRVIEDRVRANPERLTQEYEDKYQRLLGISLSLRTGLPIVDSKITTPTTVITDDGPSFDLRDSDPSKQPDDQ